MEILFIVINIGLCIFHLCTDIFYFYFHWNLDKKLLFCRFSVFLLLNSILLNWPGLTWKDYIQLELRFVQDNEKCYSLSCFIFAKIKSFDRIIRSSVAIWKQCARYTFDHRPRFYCIFVLSRLLRGNSIIPQEWPGLYFG